MELAGLSTTTAALAEPAPDSARIRLGRHDWKLRRLLAMGDAFSVTLAMVTVVTILGGHDPGHLLWGLFAIPLMLLLFKIYGLYDRDVKRISHSSVDDLPWLFHAAVIGSLLFWLYAKYSPMGRLDFVEVLLFGVELVVLGGAVRVVVRSVAGRVLGRERALLLGSGDLALALLDKLSSHPKYRLEVIGSLTAGGIRGDELSAGPTVMGSLHELEAVAVQADVARVIFSARDIGEQELEELLRRCRALSLKVSVLPGLAEVLGPGVEIDDVEGVTVLGINPPWLPRSSQAIKRAMDVVIAALLLVVLLPVILLAILALKLTSRGPVFFAQERVGRNGRLFRLFKFRTMSADAEQRRAELLALSTESGWLKLDDDPRITPLGRWLRRLSVDEIPQLWNVLRGEMSMVGPRPLIPAEDERVQGWGRGRLDLTPGITGYWQVLGRTNIPFEEMVKLDYLYVMNWTLWEDVRLMLRTLPVVIRGQGAN